jgi:outer membrane protein assembly factor BamB
MAFYVGTGSVEGWDLTTGSMVWRWDGDALQVPSNGPRYYSAPTSAPVVVNGDLLFGIGQNVYALDGRTGRQLWTGATGTTNGADSMAAGEGYAAVTSGGALTVFSSGGNPNPPSPTGADESVSHQVDAAHDGAQAGDPLAPPLSQKWAMDLGGALTYPVIAGGRAYFAVAASGGGSQLHAVNLATGAAAWGPVTLVGPVLGGQAMLATDNGRLFAQQSGILHAFDAQSGLELWNRYVSINSSDSNSPSPVAAGGRLFAGPARLDEETGAQLWRVNVGNSRLDVVTGTDVYVDGGCENTADLAVADGRQVWNHNGTTCGSGEPDLAPVLSGGRLYFHDFAPSSTMPLAILDAGTGAPVGTYAADTPTAITGGLAYWVRGGVLEAHNSTDLSLAWTFAGDGSLATAPVVANGVVYVGSTNGNLYGVDAAQGAQLWTAAAGSAISAPDGIFATELTGLAIGEGWLLVPAGTRLVAYSR